jgi:hypothetical protein
MGNPNLFREDEEDFTGGPPVRKFTLEGDDRRGDGGFVWIERGKAHGFMNPFDEPAVVLCTITPGVLGGGVFREIRGLLGGVGRRILRRQGDVEVWVVPVKAF